MQLSTKVICGLVATGAVAGLGLIYLHRRSLRQAVKTGRLKRIMSLFESSVVCHMKDPVGLKEKIATIIEGGHSKLQILSDFDRTLSKAFVNGNKGHASFQVIENFSQTGEEVANELKALHAKYYPIEMSPTISNEEKTPLMIEWYRSSFDIGVKYGVKASLLPDMIKESRIILRDGMDGFLRKMEKFEIPLLVVSAGLGDVIDEAFSQQVDLPKRVSVLANYYDFGEDGVAIGLKNAEMLHTFNKDRTYSINQRYFDGQRTRTNAVAMGDTLGDPTMTNGIEYLSCILKIGFLNDNVEASLAQYLSVYDLVLTGDTSMDLLTVLLHEMFSEK